MFCIDQNCHSLWDVVPKLHAIAQRGQAVCHFIEDIDVAFTAIGDKANAPLRLARERFYRSGGADWGAAMFYSECLGRLPVEIRDFEPMTGLTTKALAKELGQNVDDLYDVLSPSDNWQLIGPSYVGDKKHHRLIADLTVTETGDFLREMMTVARNDTLKCFPAVDAQKRTKEWFDREEKCLDSLLIETANSRLGALYHRWMERYFRNTSVSLSYTSKLFACPNGTGMELLNVFIRDYPTAAALYNQAVEETDVGLRPLNIGRWELPFFATFDYDGHAVRTAAMLEDDVLRIDKKTFPIVDKQLPLKAMADSGIRALAGKAIVLVIQARLAPKGASVALPYRGSLYMPAAHRLEQLLGEHNLLPGRVHPLIRVRFGLLDHLKQSDTVIHLPDHLRRYFGREEITARELGEDWRRLSTGAADRLEKLRDAEFRRRWQAEHFPDQQAAIEQLDNRRRKMAKENPKNPEIREVWKTIKSRQQAILDGLLHQIADDWQAREIDFWDSRGALLPWSVALGGEAFYDKLISEADVYPDDGKHAHDHE